MRRADARPRALALRRPLVRRSACSTSTSSGSSRRPSSPWRSGQRRRLARRARPRPLPRRRRRPRDHVPLADFLSFLGVAPAAHRRGALHRLPLRPRRVAHAPRLADIYELAGRLLVSTALAFSLAGIFYLFVMVIGGFDTMYLNAVLAAIVFLVLFEPLQTEVGDAHPPVLLPRALRPRDERGRAPQATRPRARDRRDGGRP